MLTITSDILIGTSRDAADANLKQLGIGAFLNVAHDLQGGRGWSDGILYAQCGLQDGPGTEPCVYHAAALMTAGLVRTGRKVMVYDHDAGGRALAVVIFYLNLASPKSWDAWLALLRERHNEIKEPHAAHKEAFNKINWRLLSSVMEG